MARTTAAVCLMAVLVAALVAPSFARIHDLTVVGDTRRVFMIEPFGFARGGKIQLEVKNFRVSTARWLLPW